jgi:hypothetical protein
MFISREKDGTFKIKASNPPLPDVENWVKFTPLQPVLDAVLLLDCVPVNTYIPGVGVQYAAAGRIKVESLYKLED